MPRLCNLLEAWMLLILGTVLLIPAPELPSVNGKSCLYAMWGTATNTTTHFFWSETKEPRFHPGAES